MALFLTFAFPKEQYVYVPQGPSIEARIDLEGKIDETKLKHQQDLEQQKQKEYQEKIQQQMEDIALKCKEEKERRIAEVERLKKADPVSYLANRMQANTGVSADMWRRLIFKECGNNVYIDTGNGYYGAFQIAYKYWGGRGSDLDTQVAIATKIYRQQGMKAWPNTWG